MFYTYIIPHAQIVQSKNVFVPCDTVIFCGISFNSMINIPTAAYSGFQSLQ